jgi:hypothetical protein
MLHIFLTLFSPKFRIANNWRQWLLCILLVTYRALITASSCALTYQRSKLEVSRIIRPGIVHEKSPSSDFVLGVGDQIVQALNVGLASAYFVPFVGIKIECVDFPLLELKHFWGQHYLFLK